MCRSGFGAQSGDYSLTIESLSVLVEPSKPEGIVGRFIASVQSFYEGHFGWLRSLWKREDRGVRLV